MFKVNLGMLEGGVEIIDAVERLKTRFSGVEIDVKDYGAVGDGVTDDSEAIRAAIADLPFIGGTLKFPDEGVYLLGDGILDPVNGTGTSYPEDIAAGDGRPDIDTDADIGRDIRLRFENLKDVTVKGYGATIRSHAGNGETKRNGIFSFKNCRGVTLLGITVDGNKDARQPSLSDYSNADGWNNRSNIAFSNCHDVFIKDVDSLNSMMDGIAFGGSTGQVIEGIQIYNTVCDNAYRNGLTLSTTRFVHIEGSKFTNTGKTYGTAPMLGADIEADYSGTVNQNAVFSKCLFKGNVVGGLAFAAGSVNNHVEHCTFDGPEQGPTFGFVSDVWGYNYVTKSQFIDCGISTEARGVYYMHNEFLAKPEIASGETGGVEFMHLQGPDVEDEAMVYILNNTFRIDLTNVSPTAAAADLGRFWIMDRTNAVVKHNTFINFYCTEDTGMYLFRLGNGNSIVKDNEFRFDAEDFEGHLVNFYPPYFFNGVSGYPGRLNFFEGNRFTGYPDKLPSYVNQIKYQSVVDGPTYQKSVSLMPMEVTKIDPTLVGGGRDTPFFHLKVEVFYATTVAVYELHRSWETGEELRVFRNGKPTRDLSELEVNFYRDGDDVYLESTGYYSVAKVTLIFSANQNVSSIDPDKNIFVLADEADIAGLTKITQKQKKWIDVADFGAKADGITDDSEAIKAAIAALADDRATLYIPQGIYVHGDGIEDLETGTGNSYVEDPANPGQVLIDGNNPVDIGRDIRFRFENKTNLTVIGYGAKIASHPGNGECVHNSIFSFDNCDGLTVLGLTIDGNKTLREPMFDDTSGSNGRGNFAVTASERVTIRDVVSEESMMDGFYMAGLDGADPVKNLFMDNCVAKGAYRNGLTISNAIGAIVNGGRYIDTGKDYGILPMAGIDIECDWEDTYSTGVVIRDAYIAGNEIQGISPSFRSENLRIEGCFFDDQVNTIYYQDASEGPTHTLIDKCLFLNCAMGTDIVSAKYTNNHVLYKPVSGPGEDVDFYFLSLDTLSNDYGRVDFLHNTFEVDMSGIDPATAYLNLGRIDLSDRENVAFEDNVIINMTTYGGFSGYTFNYNPNGTTVRRNKFIYTYDHNVFPPWWGCFLAIPPTAQMNAIVDNTFEGYPKEVYLAMSGDVNKTNTFGQTHQRSFILEQGQLYKIDPFAIAEDNNTLANHIKMRISYYSYSVEANIVIDGTSVKYTLKAFDSDSPMHDDLNFFNMWHKDGVLFIKGIDQFVTVQYESVMGGGNGAGTQLIDGDQNILSAAVDGDETGGTLMGLTLHAPSAYELADMTALIKPTGQSVFVTTLAKPVWWDGTEWVDVNGITVT